MNVSTTTTTAGQLVRGQAYKFLLSGTVETSARTFVLDRALLRSVTQLDDGTTYLYLSIGGQSRSMIVPSSTPLTVQEVVA